MRTNFHTHTVFCDGADEPAALVRRALALGFSALGFSGHSDTGFDPCGMAPERETAYRAEITRLKAAYAGRIALFCGIEQDWFSGLRDPFYDYAIGSVHYVEKGGARLAVDWSPEETARIVREAFGGDPYAFADAYYAKAAQVQAVTGCDIIGHFDLIRKFDEQGAMFDEAHPRYRAAVLGALDALAPGRPIFEINTGAIARGWRKTPFPSLWILREIRARGCPIALGSDCHDKNFLDCGLDDAAALAREAGFRGQVVLTGAGWAEVPL